MERVQLPLLPCTKGPGLTAVQECAQDTGSIDLDLGICRQRLTEPYSVSLENMVAALPMRLLSSTSRERVSESVEPRYTTSNSCLEMAIEGGESTPWPMTGRHPLICVPAWSWELDLMALYAPSNFTIL